MSHDLGTKTPSPVVSASAIDTRAASQRLAARSTSIPASISLERVVVLTLILGLSAAVRLADLSRFATYVFDEYYYVHDARAILQGDIGPTGKEPWRPGSERSAAHPELGKLTIAAGMLLAGDRPLGWRLMPALAGIALIALVYPLARLLFLSRRWALLATALAASDTLLIIESRLGVLDVLVALWSTLSDLSRPRLCAQRMEPRLAGGDGSGAGLRRGDEVVRGPCPPGRGLRHRRHAPPVALREAEAPLLPDRRRPDGAAALRLHAQLRRLLHRRAHARTVAHACSATWRPSAGEYTAT